ncbi:MULTISPECIES: His-Xaa-Ser system radical SAM maturase HxsB [unclassified Pedobacter]|uniref:His-Xaa-Ser system radical SAM maturase HxsB n=1 Tax=unclassified Pedobacter TaxID=2628915 RepID=UPI001DA33FFC|nr:MULTISPECIES: His-Xaa-Ser system radical SAM maturase HxsB [unclassified Pedobacter]CAH0264236.1 Anaerobic sulfatase-maturating enzyme [Pedobacter sp. Bi36]CAH0290742.1 Anaerobic sulfatase-maturating enzyme [Pedobacter sp. Bi126]
MIVSTLSRPNRKFKDTDYFSVKTETYFLMPFRFHRLNSQREVVVNEVGDHLVYPTGTVARIIGREIDKQLDSELYADLIAGMFISESPIPALIDVLATRYRTKKSFLDDFTNLHIFVITLRCEHTCHYCQVSRVTTDKDAFDMSKKHIDRGIDLMMESPNPFVTMEFQGGEALLAFDNIKYAVERTKRLAVSYNKKVTYVICTNLAVITMEILEYCKENGILLSTSLDGPGFIHNQNRRRPGNNSYELTVAGIEMANNVIEKDSISALMTATNLSLAHPIEIVEEYRARGFDSIFLRPISPYGFALSNERKNKYAMDDFLSFYKTALQHIIAYNLKGEFFREQYATIILKKILTPFPVGYVDLNSPAGAITNVILFNYDGNVYATDESRMLAESGDYTFRLGHLDSSSYEEIFYGERAMEIAEVMTNESLPGCSECAFQSYCGSDPVHNHATQGDIWGYRPTSTFCRKNMEIIRYLIELMDGSEEITKVFESWIR